MIYTTPKDTILEGNPREAGITLAKDTWTGVVNELISRNQLYIADAVFVCGTATQVVGVQMIDKCGFGEGGAGLQKVAGLCRVSQCVWCRWMYFRGTNSSCIASLEGWFFPF